MGTEEQADKHRIEPQGWEGLTRCQREGRRSEQAREAWQEKKGAHPKGSDMYLYVQAQVISHLLPVVLNLTLIYMSIGYTIGDENN